MRKLIVYVLADISSSMQGPPVQALNNGIAMLVNTLQSDPQALESVHFSCIPFNSTAKQDMPLTPLTEVIAPTYSASGSTALGDALRVLKQCIDKEVTIGSTQKEIKGDFKPLIFIVTDGEPNKGWETAYDALDKTKIGKIIGCAVPGANLKILSQICDDVIQLETASANDFQKFFEWVSQSILQVTKSIVLGDSPTNNTSEHNIIQLSDL